MFSKVTQAQRELDIEIDQVAANLIRNKGYSSWNAIEEASKIVRNRRIRKNIHAQNSEYWKKLIKNNE